MCPVSRPTLTRERLAWAERRVLVGVDEAGRGPLAGPVVAAAVVFPPGARPIAGVRDSKTLPIQRREELALAIRAGAIRLGVGAASSREIDRLNIRVATALAMRRAVGRALGSWRAGEPGAIGRPGALAPQLPSSLTPYVVLVDGLPFRELGFPHEALVDGDALCYSVAAAGIVAKTVRDRVMRALAARHPGYGWETNMGYWSAAHLAGLAAAGVTRHHRMSFAPMSQGELWEGGPADRGTLSPTA
ncbi:MAG TPA: ribonuclease HII [Gemmatimonadales bacterium]|nr:ribonuclease HII [Gemmatimonadales bacterium]